MVLDISSANYRLNPYPYFKRLRAETSLCRIKPYGYWVISRYTDIQTILKNPDLFSSAGLVREPSIQSPEFFLFSRGLIGMDKPDHSRLRRVLSKAFTPETVRALEPKIKRVCRELIQILRKSNPVDFVQTFSMPLPILIIAELLGIDADKIHDFKRWANILLSWRNQSMIPEISHDLKAMFDYFNKVIAARKQSPRNDLISALNRACEEDNTISSGEMLGLIRLLLVAGTETTTNLLSNAMLALLEHPDTLKQLQQNPTEISSFIEEVLRYDGPVLSLSRRATIDIEISGVQIRKNEIVLPLLASANHDETVFSNPEKLDIGRNTQGHLAFGTSIHYCLGSQLARLQARVAFEELFNVFKDFVRADCEPLRYLDSFFFRGLQRLSLIMVQNFSKLSAENANR